MKTTKIIKAMAMLLVAANLVGCSVSSLFDKDDDTKNAGLSGSFNIAIVGNPENLDPQTATDSSSKTIITNIFEGLMKVRENGELGKGIAESYNVSSDGLVYTFKIRKDAKWFYDKNNDDIADKDEYTQLTADDFVFAFQRIFNPVTESSYVNTYSFLKNAKEIAAGNMDYTSIGVTAPDKYTVKFELDTANPYFLNLLATSSAMPCNEEFFNKTEGRYGLDDRSIDFNGPFYLTQWYYDEYGKDNFIYLYQNYKYKNDNTDAIAPYFVKVIIENDKDAVKDDFVKGKADLFLTEEYEDQYFESKRYNVTDYQYETSGLIFNSSDNFMKSTNLRTAMLFAMNTDKLAQDNDSINIGHGIIPPALQILGRSYRELYSDAELGIKQDLGQAQRYYAAALSELGTSSIDTQDFLVRSDDIDASVLQELTQQWKTNIGFTASVDEVTTDDYKKRIASGNYSLALYNISSDTDTPEGFFDTFMQDGNIFSFDHTQIDSLENQVQTKQEISDRIPLYGEMEKNIISSQCFVPLFYKSIYLITGKETDGYIYDPFEKTINWQYAKKYTTD